MSTTLRTDDFVNKNPITVVAGGNTYNAVFRDGVYSVRNVNNNTFIGTVESAGPHFGYGFRFADGTTTTFKDSTISSQQDLIEVAIRYYIKLKL